MFPSSVIAAAQDIGVDVSSTGQTEVPLLKQILAAQVATADSGGNTNNALVPADAPIQPAQAFVDAFSAIIAAGWGQIHGGVFTFRDCEITSLTDSFIHSIASYIQNVTASGELYFSGNAINQAKINSILTIFAAISPDAPNGIIDLSGGTNADPAGGLANADIVTLGDNGWTGFINVAGAPTAFP